MLDSKSFRAMSCGVYVIAAQDEDTKAGCIVNTLTQVTSKPARVIVAINKDNFTTGVVLSSGRFEASVLAESAPMELIGRFGFRSSADTDKFSDTEIRIDEAGVPYVAEHVVSHMGVRVLSSEDVGSHMLIVGEVEEADVLSTEAPMTYAYYHQVKGGKTPPKASSYEAPDIADDANGSDASQPSDAGVGSGSAPRYGWQCQVCGYVVEIDELPDDFVCPVCGVGKENFVRVEL